MRKMEKIEFAETMKVRITFTEDVLGMANSDPEIHEKFIASKAPDAPSREEEVAAVGAEEVVEKTKTIFPKDENGNPFMFDYQIRGFFKDACKMLRKMPDSKSSKLKNYKQEIDGLIFIVEREIPIHFSGEIGDCQRPLRASTAQGERIALANSESIHKGAWMEFTVGVMNKSDMNYVIEWLNYGQLRGLGQWRNSGKGKFEWEEIE